MEVRRRAASVTVRAAPPKRVEAVAMESPAETAVSEKESAAAAAAAGAGAEDVPPEEELPVTPWAFSVAR
jgi:malate dehydrogenase (oxaloacetate-decarboxylating)(NADP+)